jgi:hemin uptake protein HemP
MSSALHFSQALNLPPCGAPSPEAAPATQTSVVTSGCVNSTEILRGQKAVEISHNGFIYRLQATRLGKLILTK